MISKNEKLAITACLSPAIQRTQVIRSFSTDEVNRCEESYIDAAGKGVGVSRVLRQLGIPNIHLCHGGTNEAEFASLLKHDGIDHYLAPSNSPIRHCITVLSIDPGKSTQGHAFYESVTEIVEPSNPVQEETGTALRKHWNLKLQESAVASISGSVAPGYPEDMIANLVEDALAQNVYVLLDVRGNDLLSAYKHLPHVVKVNIAEFTKTFLPEQAGFIELCESEGNEDHKGLIEETLIDLTEETRSTIIITRGPKSIWFANKGSYGIFEPAHIARHKVVNPIGSGDAFSAGIAAFIHAHGEEISFDEGLNYDQTIEALKLAGHCAHENTKLVRPARIR